MAAAWLANASACRAGSPAHQSVLNDATNESPAAVVSATTGIFTLCTRTTPSLFTATEPFPPSVTMRFSTPFSRKISATARRSSSFTPFSSTRMGCPAMAAASCSFGEKNVAQRKSSGETGAAGAGFTMTGTPASCAQFATASLMNIGSSNCSMTRS